MLVVVVGIAAHAELVLVSSNDCLVVHALTEGQVAVTDVVIVVVQQGRRADVLVELPLDMPAAAVVRW